MLKRTILATMILTLLFSILPVKAEEGCYPDPSAPTYVSEYVYLLDYDTKQVLIDQGSQDQIYPASLTKMMTLIIAIEHLSDTTEVITIDDEIMGTLKQDHASRAGFDVGDEVSVLDLMYGVILPSGAECSRALALRVAGSIEAYVQLMNEKAAELGMTGTHYVNTTGLHDDDHYSTLMDTRILFEYCLQNDLFKTIIETRQHQAAPSKNYPEGLKMDSVVLKYINNLEEPDISVWIDGFLGGKSGYTIEAQYCLASLAEYQGTTYMLFTAYATGDPGVAWNIVDASSIYNYYYRYYTKQKVVSAGEVVLTRPVKNSFDGSTITFTSSEDVEMILPTNPADRSLVFTVPEVLDQDIHVGDYLGDMEIYDFDRLVYTQPLYATKPYSRNFILVGLSALTAFIQRNALLLVFILLALVVLELTLILRQRKILAQRRKRTPQ